MKSWQELLGNGGKDPRDQGEEVMPMLFEGIVQECIVKARQGAGQFKAKVQEGISLDEVETVDSGKNVISAEQI